jgi:hypothetical protein
MRWVFIAAGKNATRWSKGREEDNEYEQDDSPITFLD